MARWVTLPTPHSFFSPTASMKARCLRRDAAEPVRFVVVAAILAMRRLLPMPTDDRPVSAFTVSLSALPLPVADRRGGRCRSCPETPRRWSLLHRGEKVEDRHDAGSPGCSPFSADGQEVGAEAQGLTHRHRQWMPCCAPCSSPPRLPNADSPPMTSTSSAYWGGPASHRRIEGIEVDMEVYGSMRASTGGV